jgi:hypothetical protein
MGRQYDLLVSIEGTGDVEAVLEHYQGEKLTLEQELAQVDADLDAEVEANMAEIDAAQARINQAAQDRATEEVSNLSFADRVRAVVDEVRNKREAEDIAVAAFGRNAKRVLDQVQRDVERMKAHTISSTRRAAELISRAYSVVNSAMRLFGFQLPAMMGATIQFIVSTAQALLRVASGKLVAQDYVGAALTFTAAALTFAHQVVAEMERQQVEQETKSILAAGMSQEAAMRTVRSSISI